MALDESFLEQAFHNLGGRRVRAPLMLMKLIVQLPNRGRTKLPQFNQNVILELIGWQLSRGEAVLNESDIARIQKFNSKLGNFAIECNSHARKAYHIQTGEDGISLPDPVAMCLALDPSIGTDWSSHYADVETESELTRGMTVVDRLNVADDERNRAVWDPILRKGRKAKVCWTVDNARWKESLFAALR